MKIFASADAQTPILHTLPAVNGVITQTRVPLDPEGGTVYYEIYKEGKPDSERYALEYGDPMELAADLTGLQELIAKCETIRQRMHQRHLDGLCREAGRRPDGGCRDAQGGGSRGCPGRPERGLCTAAL